MLSRIARDLRRMPMAFVVVSAIVLQSAAPALAQSTSGNASLGLQVNATARYTVDPDAGLVLVSVDYLLVNTSADRSITGFDEFLPVFATDLAATAQGRDLDTQRLGSTDGLTRWRVQLTSALRPGRDLEVTLTWTMIGGDPADPRASLVANPAYVSFPVMSVGGQRNLHAVEVSLPLGFQVIDAQDLVPASDADVVRLTDTGSLDPYVPTTVMAVRPAGLVPRRVAGLEVAVDVLGWPGDDDWSTAVSEAVASVILQLTEWMGAPEADAFEIREGPLEAYPGVIPGEVVERTAILVVDPAADAGSLGRQLANAWVGSVLPEITWFAPAATAVFGTRAAHLFDPLAADPDESDAGFDPAAYSVVDSLVVEIGADRVAEVIAAVTEGRFTYPGPGEFDVSPLPPDWRTLLDSFEGLGGSRRASDLFRRVLDDDADFAALGERAAARVDLKALQDKAAGWDLPVWLRLPMAGWDFETFRMRGLVVEDTLSERDALNEAVAAARLDMGDFVREVFENETTGMSATDALIEDENSALEAVVEVSRVVDSNSGLISRIGLIGTDVVAERASIRAAFEAGDFERVRELSDSLIKTIEGSNAVGILRIFIPSLVVIAFGSGVVELVRRRRRRRSSRAGREEQSAEPVA